ncbi:hypothetical protein Bbelb_232540, partial [Branchiostoma belcheri]
MFVFAILVQPGPVRDNRGTEFVLAFIENSQRDGQVPRLYIIGTRATSTRVTVTVPAASFTTSVSVTSAAPGGVEMSGSQKGSWAASVTAEDEIVVYGVTKGDGFLALPTDVLGKEYFVPCSTVGMVSRSVTSGGGDFMMMAMEMAMIPTEFGVVGVEDGTTVSIIPTIYVTFDGQNYNAGDTLTVTLNRMESLQMQAQFGDLTGSKITSDKPVAVFSGNKFKVAFDVSGNGGQVVEMVPPVDTWGQEFVVIPLNDSIGESKIRVLSARDDTKVSVTGESAQTLDAGEYWTLDVPSDQYISVSATAPVLVVQYRIKNLNDVPSDSFMMVIPPVSQFVTEYSFTAAEFHSDLEHHVSVVIKTSEIDGLRLDGAALDAGLNWTVIPDTDMSAARIHVQGGDHTLSHTSPIVPFGVTCYAYTENDAYGYPGGLRLAEVTSPCARSLPYAGDGLDNDCDGVIDEELLNEWDDDGDGRIDEDLAADGIVHLTRTDDGFTFYKVPVTGVMTSANVQTACEAVRMSYPCYETNSDNNKWAQGCIEHSLNLDNVKTFRVLSEKICNTASEASCLPLDGVFVYIPDWQSGSARGIDVSTSAFDLEGNNFYNKYALCTGVCNGGVPLGMENGLIPDGNITASSTHVNCSTETARLKSAVPGRTAGWCPETANTDQWLQVHLESEVRVTGVVVQGQGGGHDDAWVTSFKLLHSLDGDTWTVYLDGQGREKVFSGNSDKNTAVTTALERPVIASYVRFRPQTWFHAMVMRVEVLGTYGRQVNSTWAEWSPWTECNVTCGSGVRSRTRRCVPPAPMCGGTDNCVGNSTETVSCSPGIKCGAVGGLWHMNGDCGLLDVTGNGNDGTAQNTPLAGGPNGETDGSYLFQGTSTSYVDIPNNGHLDTQYSITILAHILPTSTYGQVLIYKADDSPRLRLYQYDTTKVYMRTADRTGESTDYFGASSWTTNSWNYIGGSYNYSSGEISVWHDGVKVGSNWIEPTEIRTQYPIRLGVMDHYSYFSGRMSCLQIYGHAMTEEEVAAARGRCAAIRCPVLTAPNNGRMTGCNSFNQTVQFVCDAGFTLRGASDTTCQANGTWSDEVPTCIAPPTGFTVDLRGQTYIVVTWQAPENQTTDSYTVQVKWVHDDNRDDCSVPTNGELRSNCTGLRSGVKYRFIITANIGSVSSEEVTIEERSFPPNPVEVSLVSGPDTITATWEIQNLHLGYWTSTTAEITPPDGNDVVRVAAADSLPQLTAVFTSLVSGRTYTVGVQVISHTIASEVVNVTTTIAPNAPTAVQFAAAERSLALNWQRPTGDIGIYRLELSSGGTIINSVNLSADTTHHEFTGLIQGREYFVSMVSVSGSDGYLATSQEVNTTKRLEPAAPKDVKVSAVTTSSIAVSWEAAEGDVEGYIVAITAIDECQVAGNADMTGLDAGCRYRLMVMTFSGELKTHVSLEQSTKPESPRNFRVSFLGEFGIVVVWDPPSSGLFSQYIVSISPAHGTDPEVSLSPSDDRTGWEDNAASFRIGEGMLETERGTSMSECVASETYCATGYSTYFWFNPGKTSSFLAVPGDGIDLLGIEIGSGVAHPGFLFTSPSSTRSTFQLQMIVDHAVYQAFVHLPDDWWSHIFFGRTHDGKAVMGVNGVEVSDVTSAPLPDVDEGTNTWLFIGPTVGEPITSTVTFDQVVFYERWSPSITLLDTGIKHKLTIKRPDDHGTYGDLACQAVGDVTTTNDSPTGSGKTLGNAGYLDCGNKYMSCVGSTVYCPRGFSLVFWLKVQCDDDVSNRTVLSNIGESYPETSRGFRLVYRPGSQELAVTMATREGDVYEAQAAIPLDTWTEIRVVGSYEGTTLIVGDTEYVGVNIASVDELTNDNETALMIGRDSEKACPIPGYHPFNGICYKNFAEKKTYVEARQRCAEDGGLLAMPKDSASNEFIFYLGDDNRWLGITDINIEGQWIFADGQSLASSGYSNWKSETHPVGLWPLNAVSGALDETGNGNDAVATGTQLTSGPFGDADGAFLFAGTAGSYLDIPNNGKLDVRYSYTILAHIYPTGPRGPIFHYRTNTNAPYYDHGVHFWQVEPGQLFNRVIERGMSYHTSPVVVADVLVQNAWNYVGGSYNSVTGMASLWYNGEFVGETYAGYSELETQAAIRVAMREVADSRYFAGRIACLQLYDFAMTQAQVEAARYKCKPRENIARGRPAWQSTTYEGEYPSKGEAGNAVDGNRETLYNVHVCAHTLDENDPWWYVDLGSPRSIERVVIFNREDCCSERLSPFRVHVGNSLAVASNPSCGGDHSAAGLITAVECAGVTGRYVGVLLPGSGRILTLCEVEVYESKDTIQPKLAIADFQFKEYALTPKQLRTIDSYLGFGLYLPMEDMKEGDTKSVHASSETFLVGECDLVLVDGVVDSALQLRGYQEKATAADFQYRWDLPAISASPLRFEVKTGGTVHIALSRTNGYRLDMYEVVLDDTSEIRRNQDSKIAVPTPNILYSHVYKRFWISWMHLDEGNVSIAVGRGDETEPFMQWTDPSSPLPILYAGYSTSSNKGDWKFSEECQASVETKSYVTDTSETLSILLWAKFSYPLKGRYFYTTSSSNNTCGLSLETKDDTSLEFKVRISQKEWSVMLDVSDRYWVHLAFAWSRTGNLDTYINGFKHICKYMTCGGDSMQQGPRQSRFELGEGPRLRHTRLKFVPLFDGTREEREPVKVVPTRDGLQLENVVAVPGNDRPTTDQNCFESLVFNSLPNDVAWDDRLEFLIDEFRMDDTTFEEGRLKYLYGKGARIRSYYFSIDYRSGNDLLDANSQASLTHHHHLHLQQSLNGHGLWLDKNRYVLGGPYHFMCLGNPSHCINGFSLSLWFKEFHIPEINGSTHLISAGDEMGNSPDGFELYHQGWGDVYVLTVTKNGTTQKITFGIREKLWTHVHVTWMGNLSVTINGVPFNGEVEYKQEPDATRIKMNSTILKLGAPVNGEQSTTTWQIVLDDIRFWEEVVPVEDAKEDYASLALKREYFYYSKGHSDFGEFPTDCLGSTIYCSVSFSLAAWVFPTAASDDMQTMLSNSGSHNQSRGFTVNYHPLTQTGTVLLTTVNKQFTVTFPMLKEKWIHVAISWDVEKDDFYLYLNGRRFLGEIEKQALQTIKTDPHTTLYFKGRYRLLSSKQDSSAETIYFKEGILPAMDVLNLYRNGNPTLRYDIPMTTTNGSFVKESFPQCSIHGEATRAVHGYRPHVNLSSCAYMDCGKLSLECLEDPTMCYGMAMSFRIAYSGSHPVKIVSVMTSDGDEVTSVDCEPESSNCMWRIEDAMLNFTAQPDEWNFVQLTMNDKYEMEAYVNGRFMASADTDLQFEWSFNTTTVATLKLGAMADDCEEGADRRLQFAGWWFKDRALKTSELRDRDTDW